MSNRIEQWKEPVTDDTMEPLSQPARAWLLNSCVVRSQVSLWCNLVWLGHSFTSCWTDPTGWGFLQGLLLQVGLFVQRIYAAVHSEKAMATHSSTLAWKIPWTEEPGRLHSMGSLRVRHHWANSLSLFTFLHWRRKWQPTPVFFPGESQGWGSLVGCRLWGLTRLNMTEAT